MGLRSGIAGAVLMRKKTNSPLIGISALLFILSIGSLSIALAIAMTAKDALLGAQAAGTFLRDASVFAAAILSGYAANGGPKTIEGGSRSKRSRANRRHEVSVTSDGDKSA